MNRTAYTRAPLLCVQSLLLAGLLAGCSHGRLGSQAEQKAAQSEADMARHRQPFDAAVLGAQSRLAAQDVARPWLAGRPQPLAREVTLPEALRASVDTALMFGGGRADLTTLAERIFLATGIPVKVTPDALLPLDGFLPRLNGAAANGATPLPAIGVLLPAGAHPLPRLLDLIANRLGVYWTFEQGGVRIYRTDTRIFNVRALTLRASAAASLGRGGKGGSEAFESASSTRIQTDGGNAIDAVKAKLEPFLTRAGVVVANGDSSGLVVVTDTREALDRIGEFLDKENKALTRRVRLLFEEIEVIANQNSEQGIDWSLVVARSQAALSYGSSTSLVSGIAGAGLAGVSSGGKWDGSAAILKALSEVGTVARRTTVPLQTLNRRPVTHAVRTTFSYIDQVQVTTVASSAGTSTAPSVTQKEETVGSFLTVIPDAQDDGQILLSIAYDNTVAQPLRTLTFGNNGNQVQLQQKTVDGMGTVQQVELRPGQPIVISGFERTQDQHDRRRVDEQAPMLFGGSGKAQRNRSTTVVIVTAQVEEGF